jgi:hypothetical protein
MLANRRLLVADRRPAQNAQFWPSFRRFIDREAAEHISGSVRVRDLVEVT